jgi:formylmethanofuran:tetrahydromethanopterin formyltransferase
LTGFKDGVLGLLSVTMLTAIFTVLSAALKAFVALSAVGGVTVAFEVVALAVGAGQGDGLNDGHESILTKPTTRKLNNFENRKYKWDTEDHSWSRVED